jgi:hypothetical protein
MAFIRSAKAGGPILRMSAAQFIIHNGPPVLAFDPDYGAPKM